MTICDFLLPTTESPRKKSRLETGEAAGSSDEENEMDVQEVDEDEEDSQEQEMHIKERQEPSHIIYQHRTFQG